MLGRGLIGLNGPAIRMGITRRNSGSEHLFEPGQWRVSAGTVGYNRSRGPVVAVDSDCRDSISLLQEAGQFQKGLHLSGGGPGVIEIADEADAYRIFVCPVAGSLAVCPRSLLAPAKCNLYLPVAAVGAVAYQKIVANTVPVVLFPVQFIENSGISIFRRRVMYHYGGPFLLNLRRRQPASWDVGDRLYRPPWRRRPDGA